MLRFPPEIEESIKPYVADYPMNLIDMKRLPEDVRCKFKSDFRVVAEYMARQGDHKAVRDYVHNDRTVLTHPGAVIDLFGALTGKKDYKIIREAIENKQKKKEEVTMVYIEDVWLREGMQQGILAMIRDNLEENISVERIVEKLDKHFSLTEKEAKEYISQVVAM